MAQTNILFHLTQSFSGSGARVELHPVNYPAFNPLNGLDDSGVRVARPDITSSVFFDNVTPNLYTVKVLSSVVRHSEFEISASAGLGTVLIQTLLTD